LIDGYVIGRSFNGGTDMFIRLYMDDDNDRGYFYIYDDGASASCSASSPTNSWLKETWVHVVGVYNNVTNQTLIYLNGTLMDTTDCTFTGINQTAWEDDEDTYIGSWWGGDTSQDWNGSIDEVMIWNRSLNASEISQLYWAGIAGGHTLNSSHTTVGDNWTLGVKPGDYEKWGTEVNSSQLLVLETPDTTAPLLSITYPTATNYTINVSQLNFTVSDETGMDKCWHNASTTNSTPVAVANFTGLTGINGSNTWTVWCNDTSNNVNSSTVTFYSTYLTGCMELDQVGLSYTLNTNALSTTTCYTISANDITLDCNGKEINYSSDGTLGYGIDNTGGYDNITIKNCVIKEGVSTTNSKIGMYFNGGADGTIENNTIITSGWASYGIYLSGDSNSNIIRNNTIATTGGDGRGISITQSPYNEFYNNSLTTTQGKSYYIYGTTKAHYNHTLGGDNLADDKPLNYSFNLEDAVYDSVNFSQYGQMILAACNNITVSNSNITQNGLNVWFTTNSTFENNNIDTTKTVDYGIFLYSSSNYNVIKGNTITTSDGNAYGIYLVTTCNNNNISDNIVSTTDSGAVTIRIVSSNNNDIDNNTVTASGYSAEGIALYRSSNNSINRLTVTTSHSHTSYGIYLYDDSLNNTISNSTFTTTGGGTSYALYANTDVLTATFIDTIFNASGSTDVYADTDTDLGSWISFINVTFNSSNVSINDVLDLNVSWYLDVYVNDSDGNNLSDVNVSAYDINSALEFSVLTASNGQITTQTVLEYVQNSTATLYYTNYTVNATKSGFADASSSANITTNIQLYLSLTDSAGPTITVMSPLNNSNYNVSSVDFNISLNEEGDWCGMSLDGAVNVSMTEFNVTYFNYTNSSMTDGVHTVVFSCNDTEGNMASNGTFSLLIDTIVPNINFTSPTPYNTSTESNNYIYINTTLVILNSSSLTNLTNESLTCYANISDSSGGTVSVNYTWYNN